MPTRRIQLISGFPQADFNQTDMTKSDYIKNKPVPLTLQEDPTTGTVGYLGQLCINANTATTFICIGVVEGVYVWQKVPTKLSDLSADVVLESGKIASVTIYANLWEQMADDNGDAIANRYYQYVTIDNATITPHSKIDLQPTPEDLLVFYEKDLTFMAINADGQVRICAIGQRPTQDYTFQVTVTEVVENA